MHAPYRIRLSYFFFQISADKGDIRRGLSMKMQPLYYDQWINNTIALNSLTEVYRYLVPLGRAAIIKHPLQFPWRVYSGFTLLLVGSIGGYWWSDWLVMWSSDGGEWALSHSPHSNIPLYPYTITHGYTHREIEVKNKEKGRTGKRKREKQRENKERQRDRKGGKEGRPHHTREQAEERKRKRAVSIATGYQW